MFRVFLFFFFLMKIVYPNDRCNIFLVFSLWQTVCLDLEMKKHDSLN